MNDSIRKNQLVQTVHGKNLYAPFWELLCPFKKIISVLYVCNRPCRLYI